MNIDTRALQSRAQASVLALLMVACGGSAELTASPSNGNTGGSARNGVSGGTSSPGDGPGGSAESGGSASGTSNGGAASGGAASGGAADQAEAGAPIGGKGAAGGAAGTGAGSGAGGSSARSCDPLTFDDPAFEALIRRTIGKLHGDITLTDVHDLQYLSASNANITTLGGIECLPLTTGQLDGNLISDLRPLAALKQLAHLDLTNDPVGDLSPLAGLDSLVLLDLNGANRLLGADDFAVLAKLPRLITLDLRFDTLGSLAPLAEAPALDTLAVSSAQLLAPESLNTLTRLTMLDVSDTHVAAKAVAKLIGLRYLGFELNQATDISPLASLTSLELLDLSFNEIADIAAVTGLTKLQRLAVSNNHVVDLGPVRGLTQLNTLNAQANRIQSLAPLVQNAGLGAGDLLWLGENPIDCQAESQNLATLAALHVGVLTDCNVPP